MKDIKRIAEYLAAESESEEVAVNQLERLKEAARNLEYLPERGNPIRVKRNRILRYVIEGRYKIHYIVYDKHVTVESAIHMKRNTKY